MPSIEKEPTYDVYCISRRQYQRFLNILFGDVSVAQLVALMSGVVLGGVAEVVGSNLARGKIFTASISSVDSIYPSVYIYIYTYIYIYIFPHISYLFSNFITVQGIFKFHPRSRLLCLSQSHYHPNPDFITMQRPKRVCNRILFLTFAFVP